MKLLKSPNNWSCLPTAFAMVCGVSLEEFLEIIGHDGSEKVFSGPRPQRCFHLQECYKAATYYGFGCTQFERVMYSSPGDSQLYQQQDSDYIRLLMTSFSGVLLGLGVSVKHAVAWDTEHIYDPAGGVYGFQNQTLFSMDSFILVHKFDLIL